jgi:hypothetical protein
VSVENIALECYPMDEVPAAVIDERTTMAAALPIRMNAHSRSSIYSSQGLWNRQSAMKVLARPTAKILIDAVASIPPEILEPVRRQRCVDRGAGDGPMAEP